MRCNACWRELEGQAITTTCGHLFCQDDASKILSNDAACPVCDQVLSKSLMKSVDANPSDEWTNMVMAGVSPQILMKSAYKSVTFYIGQKELEMQFKMNRIAAQCRQKLEMMQAKFSEKMEQVHTAYQKMSKRCQMMQQEIESLSKDNQELQEKFAEKSRQKRKLDEMYDQLRTEYESVKRAAIQPKHFFPRTEPDLFADTANIMDNSMMNRDHMRKVLNPETPGPRDDIWPTARQNSSDSGLFDVTNDARQSTIPADAGNRRTGARSMGGAGTGASNPAMTLRNIIISPIRRPQLSRNRPQMFSL